MPSIRFIRVLFLSVLLFSCFAPTEAQRRGRRGRAAQSQQTNAAATSPTSKATPADSASSPPPCGPDKTPTPKVTPAASATAPADGDCHQCCGKLYSKPQPAYPDEAKAKRISGTVQIKIVVDEEGKVISTEAVSGHPLLQASALEAARKARFAPTLLGGKPVKVSGIITYLFVLN